MAVSGADDAVWRDYWRALFPKVDMAKIDEFTKKYRMSDEERADVLNAYVRLRGASTCLQPPVAHHPVSPRQVH